MTTPDAVRAHIEWLCENGMTQRHIGNLVGLSNDVISKCALGHRTLNPRIADQVMRIHPDDIDIADKPAPGPDEQFEEEYDHYVNTLGWDDADFAHVIAGEMGISVDAATRRIWRMQRRRSPSGLTRMERKVLECAAGMGEIHRETSHTALALEARGLVTTTVWRGKSNARVADLTDEGRRALEMERNVHACQS